MVVWTIIVMVVLWRPRVLLFVTPTLSSISFVMIFIIVVVVMITTMVLMISKLWR